MKANELRIGNLINGIYYEYENDGDSEEIEHTFVCKVVTLDVADMCEYPICVYSNEEIEQFSEFEPIPLTEEWLLKFGFKKYPNLRDTFRQEYYDAFKLDIDEHTIISFSIPIGYNHNIRCNYDKSYRSEEKKQSYRVKHIHQLQNLYFALTGEELTLEP